MALRRHAALGILDDDRYRRRMRSRVPVWCSFVTLACSLFAQAPPANGPAEPDLGHWALVGGDVVVRPGERIAHATLVLANGLVVSVTKDGPAPNGARVLDCTGLTLYPGLIEPFLPIDVPAPDPDAGNVHWNPVVLPQRSALDGDGPTAEDRKALRELGFLTAAIAPTGGVFKGTAAVVLLSEPEPNRKAEILNASAYQLCSLQTRFGGNGPDSEMGAIALVRQTLADADWVQRNRAAANANPALRSVLRPTTAALTALADQRTLPLVFDLDDELQVMRVAKIAHEFERKAFVLGSGMEFRRLQAVVDTKMPIVVPLSFPETPDVSTVTKAERVSLRQLQSWEQAPTNLKRLLNAKARVALTSARLSQRRDFRQKLADAMAYGVTADEALAALTTTPAELLDISDRIGTLRPGMIANVLAVAGDLFDPKSKLRQTWIAGRRYEIAAAPVTGLDGRWQVTFAREPAVTAELSLKDGKVGVKFGEKEKEQSATNIVIDGARVEFVLTSKELGDRGPFWCRAQLLADRLEGSVRNGLGTSFALSAARAPKEAPKDPPKDGNEAKDAKGGDGKDERKGQDKASEKPEPTKPELASLDPLPVPIGGYGVLQQPAVQTVLFTGGTVWTSAAAGNVSPGAVLIENGRITYAGPANGPGLVLTPGCVTIDCTGKHITPGLIDCHSHTGISRGVNESGEAVTAEVRVRDVVNPDDINWYRELAGGVTTVNQLHGSANAIGGQSCTTKLRWGAVSPDDMVMQTQVDGIKFALGENPRGANGFRESTRYPQTRMGVEALIRDRFLAAADYREQWKNYNALDPKQRAAVVPPRRDLELTALAEVLAGTRRVHCHSYRQDEIFMLCGIAKEFGFRIGTFQHVLEGYKVGEAIRESAYGASSFSDWWAYKLEVFDAIPENGAILHEVGVNVSFNSDSDELARRLNTEAGKAVKYGGLAPADALKFVTWNPAVQLGIEAQVGSLEQGKAADLAIWSADPLSYAAICEQTWVEGTLRFSRKADAELRSKANQERQRLLQKALAAGKDRKPRGGPDPKDAYWRAEDLTESYCCRDCEGARR